MKALIKNMQDTVPPNRNAWATGAAQLAEALGSTSPVHAAVGNLCTVTKEPKP